MNWAAISTVTVLLFLFGISLQVSWQVDGLLNRVGGQLEVSVFIKPEAKTVQVREQVVQWPEVDGVEIIAKEQAWQELLVDLGASKIAESTQALEGNPLLDELKVRARHTAQVPKLAQRLSQLPGVDGVQYINEALKQLAELNQGLQRVSFAVIVLLTLTALAVITTTIRLIVMARRRDIEVMQLVGATATWIYLPFIVQGVTFGLTGAAIAWAFVTTVRLLLRQLLAQQQNLLEFLANGLSLTVGEQILLPLVLLGFGSLVGLLGSLVAVRRLARH
jgi:cell division transport system permease protein